MNAYTRQWLLAVALKRPYPSLDAGALSESDKQTQRSSLVISGGVAAVGLMVGWFLAP